MDSHKVLTHYPPFPEDVPTCSLFTISLSKLLARDEAETQRLIQACQEIGFFYLDLQDVGSTSKILEDVERIFHTAVDLFDQPLEEKMKYDFSGRNSYFGYKVTGAEVLRDGHVDRNESYNVSRNEMLGITNDFPIPEDLERSRPVFQSMMRTSHSIASLLLELINDNLGLPKNTLNNMHRIDLPSGDAVRLIKAPPQPENDRRTALAEHTDYGSITIVFNRMGGLQVLPPGETTKWVYVRPLSGHAIVNIGDAMVKFTNGLLRSNLHRIVSPPGDQANHTRYSMLYFCRPDDHVLLRRLEGSSRIPELGQGAVEEVINSKDWIIRRGLGRRSNLPSIDFDKTAGTETMNRSVQVKA